MVSSPWSFQALEGPVRTLLRVPPAPAPVVALVPALFLSALAATQGTLDEWRQVRYRQDAAYRESLEMDQLKCRQREDQECKEQVQ